MRRPAIKGFSRHYRIRGRLEQMGMLLLISAAVGGCAGRTPVSPQPDASPLTKVGASTRLDGPILPPELRAASGLSAYEAILKLRPGFFTGNRSIGSTTAAVRPSVILERGIPEPLDVLRQVSADAIAEIRFIEPQEATLHYGPAFTAGVIVVRLVLKPTPFEQECRSVSVSAPRPSARALA
jgi:hypothetical protein